MITLVLILLALVYVVGGIAALLKIAWWGGALLAISIAVRFLAEARQARLRAIEQSESLGGIPDLMHRRRDGPLRTD